MGPPPAAGGTCLCLCAFGGLPQREQSNHPAAAYSSTQFEPLFTVEQSAEYTAEQFQQ